MAPRAIRYICPQAFFRRDFFSTGIPTSSHFPAASNRDWEARRPNLAGKFAKTGAGRLGGLRFFLTGIPTSSFFLAALNRGWEARRPDLAGNSPEWGLGGSAA